MQKNEFKPFLISLFLLVALTGCFFSSMAVAQTADENALLSLKDLNDARTLILSESVAFGKRVELAAAVTGQLELIKRSPEARRLTLDFFGSITASLQQSLKRAPASLAQNKPYSDYIAQIERGKRNTVVQDIQKELKAVENPKPPAILTLIALKADDMFTAYFALYTDVTDRDIGAYSYYLLGILAAREGRFVEAERYLDQAKDGLGSPILEKWLTLDRAKIAIAMNNLDQSNELISGLLKANSKDVRALSLSILQDIVQNKKNTARQTLARSRKYLYEDPYLIAEFVSHALELDELKAANDILETFENKVESNQDFYVACHLVRKAQNRMEEADNYLQKAMQVQQGRVAVPGALPPTGRLEELASSSQQKRRKEISAMNDLELLDKAYLNLLSNDSIGATLELESAIQNRGDHSIERFVLAEIQRRRGEFAQAVKTLEALQKNSPKFRPYQILSLLADLSVRAGNSRQARSYYQDLRKQFPDSYQAEIADRYLNGSSREIAEPIQSFRVSTMMSRFSPYAAPFVISEIMNHWGDRTSFIAVSNRLGTNPRRGLLFHELINVLYKGISGTRYRVIPFIGTKDVLTEFIKQKIPVILCRGEMFLNQRLNTLALLVGVDPSREIFYAEGVTSSDPHLLTETEILDGVCIAVLPGSFSAALSETAKKSAEAAEEYMLLNAAAAAIESSTTYDPKEFHARKNNIAKETARGFLPHQLAYARWVTQQDKETASQTFLDSLEKNDSGSAQYWFLNARLAFRKENYSSARKLLDQAIERNPDTPRYELAQARIYYKEGKLKKAIELTEQLNQQFPDEISVSAHLIALYKKNGDTEKMKREETRLKDLLHVENVSIDLDAAEEQ